MITEQTIRDAQAIETLVEAVRNSDGAAPAMEPAIEDTERVGQLFM